MLRFFVAIVLQTTYGCSVPDKVTPQPDPTPTTEPTRWDEIKVITDTYCDRCHNGVPFLQSERQFLTERVKGRLIRREMPPPSSLESRGMDQPTRDKLVRYFP